jgi:hypothetical protein
VVEPGRQHCLALEALDQRRIAAILCIQQLERHIAAQQCVVGAVHGGHTAAPEQVNNFVAAEAPPL